MSPFHRGFHLVLTTSVQFLSKDTVSDSNSISKSYSFLTLVVQNNVDPDLLKYAGGTGNWIKQATGISSANLKKGLSSTVTLTLEPIFKKVTFDVYDKVGQFGKKGFVPITVLRLVYCMLQTSTGHSISNRSVILRVLASPSMTATGFSFTSMRMSGGIPRKNILEWYVSFF